MNSQYNTGKPIDIAQLSNEERIQAFHEWAEGSDALEQLLNDGYDKGFLSHACCGGDTGKPYVDYELNDEYSRKMAMGIAEQLVNGDYDCSVTIYDNFLLNEAYPQEYPTKDIISLNVQTKMENREIVFSAMSKAIRELEVDKVKLPQTESEIPSKKFRENKVEIQENNFKNGNLENLPARQNRFSRFFNQMRSRFLKRRVDVIQNTNEYNETKQQITETKKEEKKSWELEPDEKTRIQRESVEIAEKHREQQDKQPQQQNQEQVETQMIQGQAPQQPIRDMGDMEL